MGLFTPVVFVFRTFNTAANVYLAGQIGWWAFKKIRELQKEHLRGSEIKRRFIEEYQRRYGEAPSSDLVAMAMRSSEAVDQPIKHRVKTWMGMNQ